MFSDIERLEAERNHLYQNLSQIGDFRRGSINEIYRRCGKPNCACTKPDNPGHGPQPVLTKKVNGKTLTKSLRSGPEVEKVRSEISNHDQFQKLIKEIVEINERICDLKDTELQADVESAKKGASKPASKRKSLTNSAPS